MFRRHGDTNAHADGRRHAVADRVRTGDRCNQLLAERDRTIKRHSFGQHYKFVASDPCGAVASAQLPVQTSGNDREQLVAGSMAERVVNGLKAVKIKKEEGERAVVAGSGLQFGLDRIDQSGTVCQAGENIVPGAMVVFPLRAHGGDHHLIKFEGRCGHGQEIHRCLQDNDIE